MFRIRGQLLMIAKLLQSLAYGTVGVAEITFRAD
jgi:hypothetical protein